MQLSVKLPAVFCPGCRTQMVTHILVRTGTDILTCLHCATAGDRAAFAPVHPLTGWAGMGFAPPLDPVDAVALLARHGAVLQ